MESTNRSVVEGHFAFALQNVNFDRWLAVCCCREDLGLLGWDGCVALNEFCHDPTQGLDTEGQGRDIQEKDVCHFPSQNTRLNRCPNGHHLIRIDPAIRFFAKQALHQFLYFGYARTSPNQDHFINFGGG